MGKHMPSTPGGGGRAVSRKWSAALLMLFWSSVSGHGLLVSFNMLMMLM